MFIKDGSKSILFVTIGKPILRIMDLNHFLENMITNTIVVWILNYIQMVSYRSFIWLRQIGPIMIQFECNLDLMRDSSFG